MGKITAIIQARMGSTRFPKKVMADILGKPVLYRIAERLKYSRFLKQIIIATTNLSQDDVIEEFARKHRFLLYRGSATNVLQRFNFTAHTFSADPIVRITADEPLIDPKLVDKLLKFYLSHKYDFVGTGIPRTYPDGLDFDIFSFSALDRACKHTLDPYEKEHVSPAFYQHQNIFKVYFYSRSPNLYHYRLTLDYPQDLITIRKIYRHFYPQKKIFYMNDIIKFIDHEKKKNSKLP